VNADLQQPILKPLLGTLLFAALAATAASAKPTPEMVASGEVLGSMKANTSPDKVYSIWNRFCRAHFGAQKEPLVYELFGKELKLVKGGRWVHVSATSACIAWETNLPALSHVEYGQTLERPEKTAAPERPYYLHVHYLTDLKPKTPYRYRMVATGERGNRTTSAEMTLTAGEPEGAIHFPGELAGPPYVLDRADSTYILDKDLVTSGTAIEIAAPGITLDLDGHAVIYHNQTIPSEAFNDKWMSYVHKGAVGIKNFGQSGFTLLNGTIRQGAGQNTGNTESTGFIPVYLRDTGKVRIAGVTVDYHSPQNTGMRVRNGKDDVDVHHNVFIDRGCIIRNRHGAAVRALSFIGSRGANCRVHHNLVKRTRQMGLLGADQLNHNEVYVDSWSVNSFALGVWKVSGEGHHNRVFGTGVNVQGFGWGERDTRIHHNLIHLQGINTGLNRGKEGWGDKDSMNGLRVTNYGKGGQVRDNLLYHDNLIVIKCRGGSQARGTEFFSDASITNLLCRDTTIKVETEDNQTSQVACVVTHGHPQKADTALPVKYRGLTLISNLCHVRMGDYYGKGSNHHFVRCKLIRTGKDSRYHTFIVDGAYWSKRHVLLDCEFGTGASPDDVFWKRTSWKSFYSVKWTLTLKTAPGAKVVVKDKDGEVELEGKASPEGLVKAPLTQYVIQMSPGRKSPCLEHVKEVKTPHRVEVTVNGKTEAANVEMSGSKELALAP